MGNVFSRQRTPWFSLDDVFFQIGQENLRVRAEQLRTRLNVYLSLVLSQVVLQILFVWLFWSQASHQYLLSWLAIFYALHVVELVKWSSRRGNLDTMQDCKDWHVHFTVFALAAGVMWGIATMVFFPTDIAYQSLLICVMLGLVAGAVTVNSVHLPSLYGYLFGIMIPLILRVAFENDMIHWILALMLGVYAAVVVQEGTGMNRTLMLALQQRFDNLSLLQQVTAQKAEIEDARIQLERANNTLQNNESRLAQMVHERTAQLELRSQEMVAIKDTTILALTSLAGTRDNETGNHIRRTQHYVRTLALHLRDHPRFRNFLTDDNIELLFKIAPLHDIGKVGIPDRILHKPGKLTLEEFEIMKTHTVLGGNAISGAENMTNVRNSPFLKAARQIAIGHHEKWDGSGYPFGLREDHIPFPARLMALADVYDAMSCRRVYKSAMAHDEVAEVIINGKEKHFDPDVVSAFVASVDEFKQIAARYRDEESVVPAWKVAA